MAADLSTETWQAMRDWHDIVRALNEKNMQLRRLYSARLSLKIEGEIKKLPGQIKPKRICKHQTNPTENIERGPISKERA